QITEDPEPLSRRLVLQTSLQICRYIFWFFATELLLHYIHVSAMHYSPYLLQHKLDLVSLCGLGYMMGKREREREKYCLFILYYYISIKYHCSPFKVSLIGLD